MARADVVTYDKLEDSEITLTLFDEGDVSTQVIDEQKCAKHLEKYHFEDFSPVKKSQNFGDTISVSHFPSRSLEIENNKVEYDPYDFDPKINECQKNDEFAQLQSHCSNRNSSRGYYPFLSDEHNQNVDNNVIHSGILKVKSYKVLFEKYSIRSTKIFIKTEVKTLLKRIVKRIVRESLFTNVKIYKEESIALDNFGSLNNKGSDNLTPSGTAISLKSSEEERRVQEDSNLTAPFKIHKKTTDYNHGIEIEPLCHNCKGIVDNNDSAIRTGTKPPCPNNALIHQSLETSSLDPDNNRQYRAIATSPIQISSKDEEINKLSSLLNCMSGRHQSKKASMKSSVMNHKLRSTSRAIFGRLFSRESSLSKNSSCREILSISPAAFSKVEKSNSFTNKFRFNFNYSSPSSPSRFTPAETSRTKNESQEIEETSRFYDLETNSVPPPEESQTYLPASNIDKKPSTKILQEDSPSTSTSVQAIIIID